MEIPGTALPLNGPAGERIESWKQIAAYFARDERTVKRWEQERGLPIHRMPGTRGGVFAYKAELTAWLDSGKSDATQGKQAPQNKDGPQTKQESPMMDLALPQVFREPEPLDVATPAYDTERRPIFGDWAAWMAAAAAVALLALVALRLPAHVRGATAAHGPDTGSNQREAREFYLQGRYYWNRRTEESLQRAADAFTQAIVRDANYAPAYAGLAETYDLLPQFTSMPTAEALSRAIIAARKAIALDETEPSAHRALGWALFFGPWDVNGALAEYRRAIELDPQSADSHHWYGNALFTVGRMAEARAEMETARKLDPGSRAIQMDLGQIEFWSGERKAAIDRMLTVERVEPDFLAAPRYLMTQFFEEGDLGQYISQSKLAAALSHDAVAMSVAGAAERGWQTGGERGMLLALYTRQKELFDQGHSSGFDLARTCVRLDMRHDAAMYFERAIERNDGRVMSIFIGMVQDRMKDDAEFRHVEEMVEAKTGFPFITAMGGQRTITSLRQ